MEYTKRLRELREEKGYSQEKIAEILQTTRQQIQKYESERQELPLRRFIELCQLYEVSADYILGFTDSREIKQ